MYATRDTEWRSIDACNLQKLGLLRAHRVAPNDNVVTTDVHIPSPILSEVLNADPGEVIAGPMRRPVVDSYTLISIY